VTGVIDVHSRKDFQALVQDPRTFDSYPGLGIDDFESFASSTQMPLELGVLRRDVKREWQTQETHGQEKLDG
jgi:hypothetical protein